MSYIASPTNGSFFTSTESDAQDLDAQGRACPVQSIFLSENYQNEKEGNPAEFLGITYLLVCLSWMLLFVSVCFDLSLETNNVIFFISHLTQFDIQYASPLISNIIFLQLLPLALLAFLCSFGIFCQFHPKPQIHFLRQ